MSHNHPSKRILFAKIALFGAPQTLYFYRTKENKLATNTPAKIPDIMRLAVTPGAETPVVFPGTVTLIDWMVQALEASGTYVSYEPGGTFSPDNYWTLKGGNVWYQQDMNWTPPENAMFLRAQGANPITVEIMYWS